DAKKIAFALNAISNKDTVKPVVALINGLKRVPPEKVTALHLLLAQIGGPEEMAKVLDYAGRDAGVTAPERDELVLAVEEAVRIRKVGRPREFTVLDPLTKVKSAAGRSAIRLIGLWRVEERRNDLM